MAALFWVSLEYVRGHFITGFPWCLMGHSQYEQLPLIQMAELFGAYGMSFLILLVNGAVHRVLFVRETPSRVWVYMERTAVVLAVSGCLIYGNHRLAEIKAEKAGAKAVRAVIVQANVDQSLKWDASYQRETIAAYERLTRASRAFEPQLIVWPETSVPFFFQRSGEYAPRILTLARESGAWLLFGSPAYERTSEVTRYFNRAYLAPPDGQALQFYDKVHLLPFGEYVPLKKVLFFVERLVPAAGDFSRGRHHDPLTFDPPLGILICYEAIFPEPSGLLARKGARLLINITNDAWFGMTGAPHQHLCMSVFRAVETRTPLIRAANTGISAFIDPTGKIMKKSPLFTESVLKSRIRIPGTPLPFYARHGDVFALFSLCLSLGFLGCFSWRRWIARP